MQEPTVLNINVGDSVKSGEKGPGNSGEQQPLFPNPKNDPNIAGVAAVDTLEKLEKLAPIAYNESKRLGKPVILIVKGK